MVRVLKILLVSIFLLLLISHVFLLINGAASYITTFTFFTAFFIILDRLIGRLKKAWKYSGWRMAFFTTLICLLGVEFILRFFLPNHLTWVEQNGNFYYSSPYRQIQIESKIRRYINKEKDLRLRTNKPNSTGLDTKPEFTYEYAYNSLGLRDEDYSPAFLKGKTVMLTLGDSYCEGVGTVQDSTWTRQLTGMINNHDPNLIGINAGTMGSDVFFEYYKLENLLSEAYDPDLVILSVNSSDIADVIIRGGMERFVSAKKISYSAPPWWEYIYSFSMLTRYIVHDIFHLENHLMTTAQHRSAEIEAEKIICDCIENNYIPFADRHGMEMIVVFHPIYYEVADGSMPYNECMRRLSSKNIQYVDLYSYFEQYPEDLDELYWPIDMHYNANGYKVMADGIYQFLLEHGLLREKMAE